MNDIAQPLTILIWLACIALALCMIGFIGMSIYMIGTRNKHTKEFGQRWSNARLKTENHAQSGGYQPIGGSNPSNPPRKP